MFFRRIYYLFSDILTSFSRRFTSRQSYVCKFAFKSVHFFPAGYSTCCESAGFAGYSDTDSATGFYHSKQCRELRQKVLRGDYSSCPETCHTRLYAEHPPAGMYNPSKSPGRIVVGHGRVFGEFRHLRDELLKHDSFDTFHMTAENSCDLKCIMCRDKIHGSTLDRSIIDLSWSELSRYLPETRIVVIGGTGEPLIQKNSLEFLCNTTEKTAPHLEQICLITNGSQLGPELWDKMTDFVKSKLELRVSVDAATEATYKKVRRGGDFKQLADHLHFLGQQQLNSFTLSMCVQEENFREMVDFIKFARSFNATATFGQVNGFPDMAPHRPDHPSHKEFLEVIKDDIFMDNDVLANFIYRLR